MIRYIHKFDNYETSISVYYTADQYEDNKIK